MDEFLKSLDPHYLWALLVIATISTILTEIVPTSGKWNYATLAVLGVISTGIGHLAADWNTVQIAFAFIAATGGAWLLNQIWRITPWLKEFKRDAPATDPPGPTIVDTIRKP